jgi:hypothetical protein
VQATAAATVEKQQHGNHPTHESPLRRADRPGPYGPADVLLAARRPAGAVVGDVQPVAAQLRRAVAAAPGAAGVDEHPVAHRRAAVAKPVVAQCVYDAEQPHANEDGKLVGSGRARRGGDAPLPTIVGVTVEGGADPRTRDQRTRAIDDPVLGGGLKDAANLPAQSVDLVEIVVGRLAAVGQGVGTNAVVGQESPEGSRIGEALTAALPHGS